MNFLKNLTDLVNKNNSLLCIGLDPDKEKLNTSPFEFCKKIVDQTHDLVCCFKPNIAYFAAFGISGYEDLQKLVHYIHAEHNVPVILDAKRGDIGNTAKQYAKEVFDVFEVDAVTVNPYLGLDALEPFLERKEKGIIILSRTSNPGAKDFQDLAVDPAGRSSKYEPLYVAVTRKIAEWNKKFENCLMVVGSTYPDEMKRIREIAPDMFFLVPGTGSQGGDLENTLKNGLTKDKSGLIISVSRAIIESEKPREKAIQIRDTINTYRT